VLFCGQNGGSPDGEEQHNSNRAEKVYHVEMGGKGPGVMIKFDYDLEYGN